MPSQKPTEPTKPARDMTTDEAIAHLFHPKVIEHAKRHANAPTPKKREPITKSMTED